MNQENDIQSCKRLLSEIAEMCEHATLTGSLSGGARRTAQRYNTLLNRLMETGDLPSGLFTAIPEDSDYAEIGVEARMLSSYFPSNREKNRNRDDGDRNVLIRLAPFIGKDELALLIKDQTEKGAALDMHSLTHLAPFLGQDILGQMVRTFLSKEKDSKEPPKPETPPSKPATPVKPDYKLEQIAPEGDSVDNLLNLLKSPYLSDEERNDLVERLRVATSR